MYSFGLISLYMYFADYKFKMNVQYNDNIFTSGVYVFFRRKFFFMPILPTKHYQLYCFIRIWGQVKV